MDKEQLVHYQMIQDRCKKIKMLNNFLYIDIYQNDRNIPSIIVQALWYYINHKVDEIEIILDLEQKK